MDFDVAHLEKLTAFWTDFFEPLCERGQEWTIHATVSQKPCGVLSVLSLAPKKRCATIVMTHPWQWPPLPDLDEWGERHPLWYRYEREFVARLCECEVAAVRLARPNAQPEENYATRAMALMRLKYIPGRITWSVPPDHYDPKIFDAFKRPTPK